MTKDPKDYQLNDFPVISTQILRYSDTDKLGHINNVVFASMFEAGRVELFVPHDPVLKAGKKEYVIARLEMDFLGEMHWPGEVKIGTGISRLGRSSVTLQQILVHDDRICGAASSVCVLIDDATRKSSPWSEDARQALEAYLLPDAGGR